MTCGDVRPGPASRRVRRPPPYSGTGISDVRRRRRRRNRRLRTARPRGCPRSATRRSGRAGGAALAENFRRCVRPRPEGVARSRRRDTASRGWGASAAPADASAGPGRGGPGIHPCRENDSRCQPRPLASFELAGWFSAAFDKRGEHGLVKRSPSPAWKSSANGPQPFVARAFRA